MNILLLISTTITSVVGWIPKDVNQFWVEPETRSVFVFESKDKPSGDEDSDLKDTLRYEVRTTDGEPFLTGTGRLEDNSLRIEASLPQGYFELELLDSQQVFGIASQPSFCPFESTETKEVDLKESRRRDPFFGIDSASTWLVSDDKTREELIRNARRMGVATYRERLSWGALEPQEGSLDFQGDRRSEFVRTTAKKYDVPILELFHSAPGWMERVGTYPVDLIKTANTWGTIGKRWNQTWNSFEVWNEPDISFSGNLPADQYVPVLKSVAQEFKREGIETPVVGGIIASFRDSFMDSLAENGGLDACDIFSFHTYCRAYEMETVCLQYHNWLVKNKSEWKPLWITECGRPWKKGTNRPDREADMTSAEDIAQKGVAAKALGIDAYFPFVYVYYEENSNNFGMCDRNNAPLRSCAAYSRLIYLLGGKRCVGSLDIEGVDRSYVFVDPETEETVVALYSRERQKGRTLRAPIKPLYVERATGERLPIKDNCVFDFSDQLIYAIFASPSELPLKKSSEVDAARELRRAASIKHGPDPRRNYSIVSRYAFDPNQVTATSSDYTIKQCDSDVFSGKITVFNFDNKATNLSVKGETYTPTELGTYEKVDDFNLDVPDSVEIPSRGSVDFEFTLNVSKISPFNPPILRFEIGSGNVTSFRLNREIKEDNIDAIVTDKATVNLAETDRWRKAASNHRIFEFLGDEPADAWGFKIEFGDGDKWAYPVFNLPIKILENGRAQLVSLDEKGTESLKDMSSFKAAAFNVKATSSSSDGEVRMFFYNEKGEYYYTASGLVKTDSNKHFVVVPFDSLNPYGGTTEKFDPQKVRGISIGLNSRAPDASLEVTDFFFFK